MKAMLIDATKCIGCRACQVACKSWNNLPGETTRFSENMSNPRYLDAVNYNRIIFREVDAPRWGSALAFYLPALHALPDPRLRQRLPGGGPAKTPGRSGGLRR